MYDDVSVYPYLLLLRYVKDFFRTSKTRHRQYVLDLVFRQKKLFFYQVLIPIKVSINTCSRDRLFRDFIER
jgi:hypothetical protein